MANKIQQAFDSIQADTQLKESTRQFLYATRRKKSRKKTGLILALACMVLSFTAGMWGYSWFQTPVSYVSIDVNPSMELALNSLDRVISAYPYNTEGAEILDSLSLKGKKYTDAIKTIMESSAMNTYLSADPELVFTVASDKNREVLLETGAADTSIQMGHDCHSVCTDIETAALAHDSGLSLGKYNAYLLLNEYDDTITVDQCRDMTMSEIHELIWKYQQKEEPPEEPEEKEDEPEPEMEENYIDNIEVPVSPAHEQENHHHHGGHH